MIAGAQQPWSAREIAMLRAVYPLLGIKGALAVLPERSEGAIRRQVRRLNVRSLRGRVAGGRLCPARCAEAMARLIAALEDVAADGPIPERAYMRQMVRNHWTAEEERMLRQVYPVKGISGAMAVLPGRSRKGVEKRASRLGLTVEMVRAEKLGVPEAIAAVIEESIVVPREVAENEPPVRKTAVVQTRRRSFEEQLRLVRGGARLAPVWRAPTSAEMRTLGGVSAGWGM